MNFKKDYDHYRITQLTFEKNHQKPKFRHFRLYVKEAQRAKRGLFSEGNTTVIRQNRP